MPAMKQVATNELTEVINLLRSQDMELYKAIEEIPNSYV